VTSGAFVFCQNRYDSLRITAVRERSSSERFGAAGVTSHGGPVADQIDSVARSPLYLNERGPTPVLLRNTKFELAQVSPSGNHGAEPHRSRLVLGGLAGARRSDRARVARSGWTS